jgi:pectate lyase
VSRLRRSRHAQAKRVRSHQTTGVAALVEQLDRRVCLSAVAPTGVDAPRVPSFPGAEGYGAESVGGRGGEVLFVTNLNDSGPGSLRAAVEASGPRTVVFRVAGVITLDSELHIDDPYLTVAGQTAPLPGITLRMNPSADTVGESESLMGIETHDVVLRYLKFRRGESRLSGDNLDIRDPSYNVIVDHVSFSWSTDESIEVWTYEETDAANAAGVQKVSIQNSIITEGLQQDTGHWLDPQVGHTVGQIADPTYTDYAGDLKANNHPLAVTIGGKPGFEAWRQVKDIDLHHNLFAHNTHRNPRSRSTGIRIINNVVYNWFTRAGSTKYSTHVDYIGNLYQHGPLTLTVDGGDQPPRPHFLWHDVTNAAGQITDPENGSLYLVSNIAPAIPEMATPDNDNWNMLMESWSSNPRGESPQLDLALQRDYPLPEAVFPVSQSLPDAGNATAFVAQAGASRFLAADGSFVSHSDFVDQRTLRSLETGNTRFIRKSRIYKTSEQAGGYGELDVQLSEAYPDADANGMSDVWESLFGIDFSSNGDTDADGYTDLEEFLNGTDPIVADSVQALDAVAVFADTYGSLVIEDVSSTGSHLTLSLDEAAGEIVVSSPVADLTPDRSTLTDTVRIPVERVADRILVSLGSGSDWLDLSGLAIRTVVSAGDGNDTVLGSMAEDQISGGTGDDRLIGMRGEDLLAGDDGNDVLLGGAGSDRLEGGSGDDLVRGQGASGDRISGGSGANTLDGGAGGDRLVEVTPAETIVLSATELWLDGERSTLIDLEIASLYATGAVVLADAREFPGDVTLGGTMGDDTLLGGAASDLLLGFGGDDLLVGGAGRDTLNGHAGRDSLYGGEGNDLLRGQGSSGDLLVGNDGSDTLDGGRGRDRIAADDEDEVVADLRDRAVLASLPVLLGL